MSESKKPVGTLCAVVRDHHSDKEDAEKFLDLGPVWMTGKGNLRFEQETIAFEHVRTPYAPRKFMIKLRPGVKLVHEK